MIEIILALAGFATGAGLVLLWWFQSGRAWKAIEPERKALKAERERLVADIAQAKEHFSKERERLMAVETDFNLRSRTLDERTREVEERRAVTTRLMAESAALKRDLLNLDIKTRKLDLDQQEQRKDQAELAERCQSLADEHLAMVEKAVARDINANNFAACKAKLTKAIAWIRSIGVEVPTEREAKLLATLKSDFEEAVRDAIEKEEQVKIKAQLREDLAREREIQRELDALARERAAIQAALDQALAQATTTHSAEVERLKQRLAEAEERNQRAIAQAQLTRAGHIYVISNIGAFGEDVFKIGMTRRLVPSDRIDELGDASVPFPFDVHMMISTLDAPKLENLLHRTFAANRINKVNPRKEFFRVNLEEVRRIVEAQMGEVRYVATPEALEYRQSQVISAEDAKYIAAVFDEAEASQGTPEVED